MSVNRIVSSRQSVTLLIAGVLASIVGTALGAAAQQTGAVDPPVVQTDRGVVVGKRVGAVDEFLGIPYAAPPIGDLRFRPPQPHAPWSAQ